MIKKPLAIILAFFIVFSPVYSYAVLPALVAAAASAGGRVLVGNVIHNVKKAALSKAGMAWMIAGGGAAATVKSAIETDGWTIEYGAGGGGAGGSWDAPDGGGVDSEGNIDVSIYKLQESPDTCSDVWYYDHPKYRDNYQSTPDAVCNTVHEDDIVSPSYYPNYSIEKFDKVTVKTSGSGVKSCSFGYTKLRNLGLHTQSITPKTTCIMRPNPSNKTYMQPDQFYDYLTINNVTINQAGDNVKNVYNYDYSQHPNITINNNTTGGNSLNNDLSLNVDPNADIKVSPRLKLDIESNRVNLDNVNDENCTKNEQGQYDVCEGSEEEDEEETDPDDPDNPSPEEPPPIECSANGFYQKICDWMDWTKQGHSSPPNTEVDVTDKTSEIVIDDSRIRFDDQCPTPKDIDITVVGHSFSDALDYQPLCDFFIKLKPFVVGMGGISSALIIAGGVRRG